MSAQPGEPSSIRFTKIRLTDEFWSEAAAIGDIDGDGQADIVVGPFWYRGPDFAERRAYAPATHTFTSTGPDGRVSVHPGYEGALGTGDRVDTNEKLLKIVDLNGDGWPDIISIGFAAGPWTVERPAAVWYENPGPAGLGSGRPWRRHLLADEVYGQSMDFADLFGDGRLILVALSGGRSGSASGRVGWFEPDPAEPTRPWTFHPISWPVDDFQWYKHGLGCGDVDGDGRMDVLDSDGWWQQPESVDGDPVWTYHPYPFHLGPNQIRLHGYRAPDDPLRVAGLYEVSPDGIPHAVTIYGGSQMYVDDIDGDGLPDIVTSLAAHGYGLVWWQQLPREDPLGARLFRRRTIIGKHPEESPYGVSFSQMQAVAFADIDGDGLADIVTGKRFWSHTRHGDPEPNGPAVLYWFQRRRTTDGDVEFVPHLIDDDSGAGTQIAIGDVNGDGLMDIVVSNTKGSFVFVQTPPP